MVVLAVFSNRPYLKRTGEEQLRKRPFINLWPTNAQREREKGGGE